MTAVEITQKAAHMIVALNVASVASTQIENHTDFDSDSIPNQVGSMIIGQVVANQTDRFTDPISVKAVAFVKTHAPKINFRRKSQES